jgi:GntR family transcriptional regulator
MVASTDWCRIEHLGPSEMPSDGSVYAALTERGLAVAHGVAQLAPGNAESKVARRLDVPRGTLLLTIRQVDSTADGVVVLVSREHHVADAFTFSVLRRGPVEEEH